MGTTNGLYVVAPGGKLQHFLYSPFGIKHIALIDDITGDGIREVVVALNDTQVPALRCYNGATWEKAWQLAPMTRIWDKLWVDRQLIINNLGLTGDGDSQSLLISSGRCVLSVSAGEGAEQWRFTASATVWRMVTLADINGDGADELFAGSNDGSLYWLNARTGKVLWRTNLPKHEAPNSRPWDNNEEQPVSDIIVLDEEAGRVTVSSGNGWVQTYSLLEKKREWDTLVFEDDPNEYSPPHCVLMSPTADVTGDGLAEVLLSETPSGLPDIGISTDGRTALCDSAGNMVWRKSSSVWLGSAFETDTFEGKPVFLQRGAGDITLVDLRDGESVLHTIRLNSLPYGGFLAKQPGDDGYLSFSSHGDLAAISAGGELLWHYPRIGNVVAQAGNFVGDGTEDVLLWGEAGTMADSAKLLRMMDGATGTIAWSYEVPYSELKSGGALRAVRVATDLVGSDNIPDIIGYCGDKVCIFSGKDGTRSSIEAGQPVTSLDVIRNGASGSALAVGTADGLTIIDSSGTPLWTTTSAEWAEGGTFVVLDDINADNVSDLAVSSASRIAVLKSQGNASAYELHQTIPSEAGFSIRIPRMVADSDNDGVRELAYLLEGRSENEKEYEHSLPRHQLCVQSLKSAKHLFKVDLQKTVFAYDLACGDFNGDGYPDSVLLIGGPDSEYGASRSLAVLSGRDGSHLSTRLYDVGGYSYGSTNDGMAFDTLPTLNAGDMNGDGADELSYTVRFEPGASWTASMQQRLLVFDVTNNTTLRETPVTPWLHQGSWGNSYSGWSDEPMLLANVNAGGHPVVFMRVAEPSVPTYDPDVTPFGSSSPGYLALVDMDSGRRLAAYMGFSPKTISFFESHQPGVLGVAACGGICFLRIDSELQVTSPEEGAQDGAHRRHRMGGARLTAASRRYSWTGSATISPTAASPRSSWRGEAAAS